MNDWSASTCAKLLEQNSWACGNDCLRMRRDVVKQPQKLLLLAAALLARAEVSKEADYTDRWCSVTILAFD
jgi:hypothetical protein